MNMFTWHISLKWALLTKQLFVRASEEACHHGKAESHQDLHCVWLGSTQAAQPCWVGSQSLFWFCSWSTLQAVSHRSLCVWPSYFRNVLSLCLSCDTKWSILPITSSQEFSVTTLRSREPCCFSSGNKTSVVQSHRGALTPPYKEERFHVFLRLPTGVWLPLGIAPFLYTPMSNLLPNSGKKIFYYFLDTLPNIFVQFPQIPP